MLAAFSILARAMGGLVVAGAAMRTIWRRRGSASIDEPGVHDGTGRSDPRPADLALLDQQGVDLHRANLRRRDLRERDFTNACLASAKLDGADLRDCTFEHTDLSWASLRGADLRGARFINCKLVEADFSDALLDGAELAGADNLMSAMWKRAWADSATTWPPQFSPSSVGIIDRSQDSRPQA